MFFPLIIVSSWLTWRPKDDLQLQGGELNQKMMHETLYRTLCAAGLGPTGQTLVLKSGLLYSAKSLKS